MYFEIGAFWPQSAVKLPDKNGGTRLKYLGARKWAKFEMSLSSRERKLYNTTIKRNGST